MATDMIELGAREVRERLDKGRKNFESVRVTEDLTKVDLSGASFKDAVAIGVTFEGSNLEGADFRNADLSSSDFSGATGLLADQFAGSNLRLARFPDGVEFGAQLENVKELSKNAGALHLATNLACAFVLLTVAGTRDIQLLTNSGTAKLPFVDVAVPTALFFTIAPIVLLIQYMVTHLYMQRLWTIFGSLPAVFPDGLSLDRKSYPWLLNDMVRLVLPKLRGVQVSVGKIQLLIFSFIAYGLVPLTISILYLRCLFTRDWNVLTLQGACFLGAIAWGWHSVYVARRELTGWRHETKSARTIHYISKTAVCLLGAILLWDINSSVAQGWNWPGGSNVHRPRLATPLAWLLEHQSTFRSYADLTEDQSLRPADWKEPDAETAPNTATVSFTARTLRKKLQSLDARGAFLINTDFRSADLSKANFSDSDLRGIKTYRKMPLSGNEEYLETQRRGGAILTDCLFIATNLAHGDLRYSDLTNAQFEDSDLRGSDASGAILKGTVFFFCDLRMSRVVGADLQGTMFQSCDLRGVDFSRCRMQGVDFEDSVVDGTTHFGEGGVAPLVIRLSGNRGDVYYAIPRPVPALPQGSVSPKTALPSMRMYPMLDEDLANLFMTQAMPGVVGGLYGIAGVSAEEAMWLMLQHQGWA